MSDRNGRLQALAAAVLFSTGGAALKTAAFSAAQISSLRSGIAALVLMLWLGGRVIWSPATFGAGVLYAATVSLFVAATKLTTAASAIFLQASAPLFIVLLGPSLLGERLRPRDLAYVGVVGLGLWLCLLGQPDAQATAPDPATGNLLAVVCSLTWALTVIALRFVERDGARNGVGLSCVVAGNALACVLALPFAWPFPQAPAVDWATVVYLGTVQIGAAYVCLVGAVRRLPAFEVSLLLLIEPVLNPLWTWWVRGEHPGSLVVVGGAGIVAATAMRAVLNQREGRSAPPRPPPV